MALPRWSLEKWFGSLMRGQIAGVAMSCLSCVSDDQVEFAAEMIIHFSGLKNLHKPGVGIFPRLLVCLNCGLSQFTLQEPELAHLVNGTPEPEPATLVKRIEKLILPGRTALPSG